MVVLRHSVRINGVTGLAITKLDILDGLDSIKICSAYKYRGVLYNEFPKEIQIFEDCEPIYEEMEGWNADTSGITDFRNLPQAAQSYIKKIETMLGTEDHLISTGQRRDELVLLKEQF